MNYINKLTSIVLNSIRSGLSGISATPSIPNRAIVEDEIVMTYQNVIKKYILKGIIPKKDLILTIRCIPVDCKDLERCNCGQNQCHTEMAHFEIPQIFSDLGDGLLIDYVGSPNMDRPFTVFTNLRTLKYSVFSRRGNKYPRVWIDTTPNCRNLNDAFIYNAPLIKSVTVSAIFKDIRQVDDFVCNMCNENPDLDDRCEISNNINFLDVEVVNIVTEKFLRYYKQLKDTPEVADLAERKP